MVGGGSDAARRQLERLATSLDEQHPHAATSRRDGLGIGGALHRMLRSPHAIEHPTGHSFVYTRNVKRWRGARNDPALGRRSAGEVQKGFRRIRVHDGHRKLATSPEVPRVGLCGEGIRAAA